MHSTPIFSNVCWYNFFLVMDFTLGNVWPWEPRSLNYFLLLFYQLDFSRDFRGKCWTDQNKIVPQLGQEVWLMTQILLDMIGLASNTIRFCLKTVQPYFTAKLLKENLHHHWILWDTLVYYKYNKMCDRKNISEKEWYSNSLNWPHIEKY